MWVKLHCRYLTADRDHAPGAVIDLPDDEAAYLVDQFGLAVPCEAPDGADSKKSRKRSSQTSGEKTPGAEVDPASGENVSAAAQEEPQ